MYKLTAQNAVHLTLPQRCQELLGRRKVGDFHVGPSHFHQGMRVGPRRHRQVVLLRVFEGSLIILNLEGAGIENLKYINRTLLHEPIKRWCLQTTRAAQCIERVGYTNEAALPSYALHSLLKIG